MILILKVFFEIGNQINQVIKQFIIFHFLLTATPYAMIKSIDTASIHRICSSQVVVDLATAVKELVENAIDAGATVIEISLTEFGESVIEVHDNARGIDPEDFKGLAMKHHTSKINQFEDLANVASYGFRGEALNSLCELSENFSVITKRVEDNSAFKLNFDRLGRYERFQIGFVYFTHNRADFSFSLKAVKTRIDNKRIRHNCSDRKIVFFFASSSRRVCSVIIVIMQFVFYRC